MHYHEETIEYQPFVTILIPVKNVARFIKDVLDALMDQTYPADLFEVLILDNNSDDGTIEIVNNYNNPKVKIIQIGIDSPPIKYNKIIPQVRGEVIGFVDGDAIVDKNWLEKVIKPLSDRKVAGATGVIKTWNTDKLIPRTIGYELQDRYERMPRAIKRAATMHIIYKKSVLLEIGGFKENLKTGYDCEIGHRINDSGHKIILIQDAIVYHHHRENLIKYTKQQFEYGQYGIIRYLEKIKFARGDELAKLRIITQPLYYCVSLLFLLLWLIFGWPWQLIFVPPLMLFLGYLYGSTRLVIKYKDITAYFVIVIFFIRPIAWAFGATIMLLRISKNIVVKIKKYLNH
ncbi:glycosyltransferase [Patescibacteria group bacterium]|nr:glycosyltransferase [Patescibacteria group bacterium]